MVDVVGMVVDVLSVSVVDDDVDESTNVVDDESLVSDVSLVGGSEESVGTLVDTSVDDDGSTESSLATPACA